MQDGDVVEFRFNVQGPRTGDDGAVNFCPACGCDQTEPPRRDDIPSMEICKCCGLQFGYDDAFGEPDMREAFYRGWRAKWRLDGCRWWSTSGPPDGWSPKEQLASRGF